MSVSKCILGLALAAGLTCSQGATFAFAQPKPAPAGSSSYDTLTDNRLGLEPNGCIKWCYMDKNPCDPDYFKQADGRCAQSR